MRNPDAWRPRSGVLFVVPIAVVCVVAVVCGSAAREFTATSRFVPNVMSGIRVDFTDGPKDRCIVCGEYQTARPIVWAFSGACYKQTFYVCVPCAKKAIASLEKANRAEIP